MAVTISNTLSPELLVIPQLCLLCSVNMRRSLLLQLPLQAWDLLQSLLASLRYQLLGVMHLLDVK